MIPDGRPAAKFLASLVLIGLSLALAWSIAPERPDDGATAMEARVSGRTRHAVEGAIERARADGDTPRVRWLEQTLARQTAFRGGRHERRNAGAAAH